MAVDLKGHVQEILRSGLRAADPHAGVRLAVERSGDDLKVGARHYDLQGVDRLIVLAAGKASVRIVEALESILCGRDLEGLVVAREADLARAPIRLPSLVADHPVPSQRSRAAADAMSHIAAAATSRDLVITAITGGSSALLCSPPVGVSLDAKRALHTELLASGARIQDINTVRKHVSSIKGGRLAALAPDSRWINLSVSDVVGDRLDCIVDPSVQDDSPHGDASSILRRYGIWERVDRSIRRHLESACDTPDLANMDIYTVLVASGRTALAAMFKDGVRRGFRVRDLGSRLEGESFVVGRQLAELVGGLESDPDDGRPWIVIAAGGETTVTGTAKNDAGGPNMELALSYATSLPAGVDHVSAFIDSDGFDGPTRFSGAIVDGTTPDRLRSAGIDVDDVLDGHESAHALDRIGDAVSLGATGTNVNDLVVIATAGREHGKALTA